MPAHRVISPPRYSHWVFTCGIALYVLVWSLAAPLKVFAKSPEVVPKGSRQLGFSINAAADGDYDRAFQHAKAIGIEATGLSLNWDQLETAPGVYGMTPDFLAIANAYYPARRTKLDLVIRPLDTNGKHVPSDLQTTSFDAPQMIERFTQLLTYIFAKIPDVELNFLSIGNEIDLGIGGDTALWQQYAVFYRAVMMQAQRLRPGLKVGTTATLPGLVQSARVPLLSINQDSDIVLVTYYPLQADFTVKNPTVMRSEIEPLLALYPNKPIYFAEVGYPSSPVLLSSTTLQQRFVSEMFHIWDVYAARIPYLSFVWLTDISSTQVDELLTYYNLRDPKFAAYLGTLGFRTAAGGGKDKPAFKTVRREARSRGW